MNLMHWMKFNRQRLSGIQFL